MISDQYGGFHATGSEDAVHAFEDAVTCVAAHRTGAIEALDRAVGHDPDLVAAHGLRGFACVVMARAEAVAMGREALKVAQQAMDGRRHATAMERVLVAALGEACEGRLLAAADRLDDLACEQPHDLLALELAHSLRFMGGDLPGMVEATSRAVPWWTGERPGAGFVYGCHAFALEEAGHLTAAERFGHRAVSLEPGDAWGLHAVSHVHETQLRVEEGAAWLEDSRAHWTKCNNFRFHMAWHLALFRLEQGAVGEVLQLYDTEIRPTSTDDFRDIANAASLLWRLTQEGVPVGDRWDELAGIARRRREETTLVFASLHNLLSLVAVGDREAAITLARAMAAPDRGTDQGTVAREIGAPLAQVILGLDQLDGCALVRLARDLPKLGGSHAQRDVFVRSLATAAASRGDAAALAGIQALRPKLRAEDRFSRIVADRLGRSVLMPRAVA